MKVKRSDCIVLSLVLQGKWFDMIDKGEKKEEYRVASEYWTTRIMNWTNRWVQSSPRKVLVVEFRRGYAKDAPRMAFAVHSTEWWTEWRTWDAVEHPEWGEPEELHVAIPLGERLTLSGDT